MAEFAALLDKRGETMIKKCNVNIETALIELGRKISKEYNAHMRSFYTWKRKCPNYQPPSDTETSGCKHNKAYAKHPNLALAWCDYNVCPLIAKGQCMPSYSKREG